MFLGVSVSYGSNTECTCMGGHVEAIRKKRHRIKQDTRNDLDDHHSSGQQDNPEGATSVLVMRFAQEHVIMRKLIQFRIEGHETGSYFA